MTKSSDVLASSSSSSSAPAPAVSKNNGGPPRTITVKEAALNLNKWKMLPPHIPANSFTKAPESKLRYNGEEVYVQFGTKQQPFYSQFGLQYYDGAKTKKYVSITRKTDVDFAHADALKFQSKSKVITGKVSEKLTLNGYTEEGTQGYYANMFMNGIKNLVIDTLMNGAEDPSDLDENGKPKIIPVVDSASLPKDAEDRRNHFVHLFEGPLYQGNPAYPPSLQASVRYVVQKDPATKQEVLTLATDMHLSTSEDPKEVVNPLEHFDHLRPKHRGVFLMSLGNIKFDKKGKEIKSALEVAKCTIVPFKRRTHEGAEMLDDDEAAE